MPATEEQKAILFVLRLLLIEGEDWKRRRGPLAPPAVAKVAAQFSPITEAQLENYLLYRGRTGRFDDGEVIYIEPPPKEKSAISAIWYRWNFDLTHPKCAFYFGIWSASPAFPTPEPRNSTTHPAFLGFRYETPEDSASHNYYHAQPCRTMGARDNPIAHAIPISQRNPTFPLAAESSLDLLLCLFTSIYGMSRLTRLRSSVSEQPTMRQNRTLCRSLDRILELQRTAEVGH